MISHDQARQMAKVYVGVLNMSEEDLSGLMAPTATVRVGDEEATLARLHEVAPPRQVSLAGWRREDPYVVVTLRVETDDGPEEREHRLRVGADGLIEELLA
jgi:hypothetical protein